MKVIVKIIEFIGFLAFGMGFSALDSDYPAMYVAMIVGFVGLGIMAFGMWLDNEFIDYRDMDIYGNRKYNRRAG